MHDPSIWGMSIGVFMVNAAVWLSIWFLVLGMDDGTFWIPVLGSFGTTWFFSEAIPAMWASFIGSFSGLGLSLWSIAQVIGLVILGLIGIAGLYFLRKWPIRILLVLYDSMIAVYHRIPRSTPYIPKQNEFFHGTTREAAKNILKTGYWLIGSSQPYGVYLSDSFQIAKSYADHMGKNGFIVLVRYNPDGRLEKHSHGHFCYPVDVQEPEQEYFLIHALTPIRILDLEGRIIK
jgi:hypothetical protein